MSQIRVCLFVFICGNRTITLQFYTSYNGGISLVRLFVCICGCHTNTLQVFTIRVYVTNMCAFLCVYIFDCHTKTLIVYILQVYTMYQIRVRLYTIYIAYSSVAITLRNQPST